MYRLISDEINLKIFKDRDVEHLKNDKLRELFISLFNDNKTHDPTVTIFKCVHDVNDVEQARVY